MIYSHFQPVASRWARPAEPFIPALFGDRGMRNADRVMVIRLAVFV